MAKPSLLRHLFIVSVIGLLIVGLAPVFAETEISDKVVVLTTQSGEMVIELFPADAPKTVENFLKLTEEKFYDRTVFHRVIKDFMIQGGDPKTRPGGYQKLTEWGTGDAGYTIPGEFNTIKHKRGIVSMARGGDPDSGSSQFFIVHQDTPSLDQNYAVFGRLATQASFDTLDKIANLETGGEGTNDIPFKWGDAEILKAEVKNRSDIPDLLEQGEPERVTPRTTEQIPYSNEKLGFSFVPPAGWFTQEPQKRNAETPDVVAVGDKIGGFTPAISVSVKSANGTTLEQYSENIMKTLRPAIDSGVLVIQNEEKTTIHGNEGYVREALGTFNVTGTQIKVKFKEVVIHSGDKFYTLTYTNSENNFAATMPKFDAVLESFSTSAQPIDLSPKDNDPKPVGECAIATAAFGSELAPQVQALREIRQNVLLGTSSGTTFMAGFNEFYYSFSPGIADLERQSPIFREIVKATITPMLSTMSILSYADIDSEQEMLGYGIGVILLNIGMYFVVPAIIIVKIKNRFWS
jgi:peptidyl-prolyl cis-trans isomerase B (cyclophilin B)